MEQETRSAPLSAGDELGAYRILSALGAGGMGVVYRARDTRLERDVALKVLPAALTADATARARLTREARTASALNHPHICHIYEVGEAAGHSYIAMELVEGRPLSQSVPEGGLPLETLLRYAAQLAEALAHAHDRGVLHRDLKSANVMVTPEGRVKILDFGLAKRAVSEAEQATRSIDSVTQAGSVAGTLHYLAPEVLRGQAADMRSDLWALGVVLYEMAAGKLPFAGRTGFEVSAAILREPPAPLPAHVPAGLRAIITRCLAKEPGQRYQRAGELRAALEAISSDTAAVPLPAAVPPAAPGDRFDRLLAFLHALFRTQEKTTWQEQVRGILMFGLFLLVLFSVLMGVGLAVKWLSPTKSAPAGSTSSAPVSQPAPSEAQPSGPRLSTGGKPSPNAEANAYFEKAQLFLKRQVDLPRARDLLGRALELDPRFAEGRAWLGLTHLLMVDMGYSNESSWLYKAEEELRQALRDDPGCFQAHAFLAAVYLHLGRKDLALAEAQRTRDLDPENTTVGHWVAHTHRLNGEYDQAIALARQSLARDPLFFPDQLILGLVLRDMGDPAGAVRELGKILDQDPQNAYALKYIARIHMDSGDMKTARAFLERARPGERKIYGMRVAWALLLALEGKRKEALKEMDAELQKYGEIMPFVAFEVAEAYGALGEKQRALDWFDRAVRLGDERLEYFQRNPHLALVRHEPRFQRILESIRFRRQEKGSHK